MSATPVLWELVTGVVWCLLPACNLNALKLRQENLQELKTALEHTVSSVGTLG